MRVPSLEEKGKQQRNKKSDEVHTIITWIGSQSWALICQTYLMENLSAHGSLGLR